MFGAFDVSRQQYDRVWGPRRSCDKAAEAHCCGRRDCRSRNPGLPILNDSDCRLRLLSNLLVEQWRDGELTWPTTHSTPAT